MYAALAAFLLARSKHSAGPVETPNEIQTPKSKPPPEALRISQTYRPDYAELTWAAANKQRFEEGLPMWPLESGLRF